MYPDWFIAELVLEEDKERARNGTLKSNEKVSFNCPVHGLYKQRVGDRIKLSTGEKIRDCPTCSRHNKKGKVKWEYPSWLEGVMDKSSWLRLVNHEVYSNESLLFHCKVHGDYYRTYGKWIHELKEERNLCPRCAKSYASKISQERKQHNRKYPEWFIDMLYSEEDKNLARSGELKSHSKVKFICPKHGVYEKWVYDVIFMGTGICKSKYCPKCYSGGYRSSYEREIEEYIRSVSSTSIETNVKGYLGKKEIDIYLPEFKLGIEFNGCYYHSVMGGSSDYLKDEFYHQLKFIEAKEKGIHLIQIFDVDWFNKKDKIKSYIKGLISSKERIFARKCEIREVSKDLANEFYNRYHLLGMTNSFNYSIGLYYKGYLISVMSFGRPRFGTEFDSELLRYCVRPGYIVVGGAQRLFKRYIKEFNIKSVLSYSDNDYFLGTVYNNLGFEGELCEHPRYFWTKRGEVEIKREKARLKYLEKEFPELYKESLNYSNKEDFIMSALGYMKVYRSGNFRWVYRIDNLKGGM